MASGNTFIYFGPGKRSIPGLIRRFGDSHGLELLVVESQEEILSLLNRSFPACLVMDASEEPEAVLELCATIKGDAFISIVPTVVLVSDRGDEDGRPPLCWPSGGC